MESGDQIDGSLETPGSATKWKGKMDNEEATHEIHRRGWNKAWVGTCLNCMEKEKTLKGPNKFMWKLYKKEGKSHCPQTSLLFN